MKNEINRGHWEELGSKYSNVWQGYAKNEMSKREMSFIVKHLNNRQTKLLDLGVGNGRILETLDNNSREGSKIYGLDISPKMVEICKEKTKSNKKIVEISTVDIANEDLPFNEKFDFVTAIRVLKYNENWKEIIKKIQCELESDGIFVFTMLNSRSINRFFKYSIPLHRTNIKELRKFLTGIGFEIIEIRSFTKLPDFFYSRANSEFIASLLIGAEELLSLLLGKVFLGRVLFIAVRKK